MLDRVSPRIVSAVSLATLALALAALPACKRAASTTSGGVPGAAATIAMEDAVTEELDEGKVAWSVGADGSVKGVVTAKGQTKSPVTSGQLTWRAPGAAPKVIPLETKDGTLVATAPKLEPGLTEVEYALVVDGKPWRGTLHVPEGGTRALVVGAETAAKDTRVTVKGPHGGVVQVVGDDRVEIVADKASGQARIYVLGEGDKAIDVGDREVRLALVADKPEVVVLVPEPGRTYFVGTFVTRVDPVKITVVVKTRGVTHACIVGWRPGAVVVVGTRAPRVAVWVHGPWIVGHHHDDDDVRIKWKQHGRGGGKTKIDIKIR